MNAPSQVPGPSAFAEPTSPLEQRLLLTSFVLWAVGVLAFEGLASLGLALVGACFFWKREWRSLRRESVTAIAGFAAWALLASTLAGRPPRGTGVARVLDWVAIPIAAIAWSRLEDAARRKVAWIAAGLFLLSCVIAGCQHFGLWPSPEWFAPIAWTKLPFQRAYESVPGMDGRFMGVGLHSHRLKFANTGGLAVLLATMVALRTSGRTRWVAATVALLGGIAVVLFPFARSATVALVATLPLVFIVSMRNRRRAVLVSLGIVVTAGLAVGLHPAARARFLSSVTSKGNGDRAYLLAAGNRAVEAHPWVGVGAGRFRIPDYAIEGTPTYVLENAGKAHNQLLTMAAETGIPGALLFCAMLALILLRAPDKAFAGIALVHFLLLSLAHDPLFHAPYSMALALALAVASAPRAWVAESRAVDSEP